MNATTALSALCVGLGLSLIYMWSTRRQTDILSARLEIALGHHVNKRSPYEGILQWLARTIGRYAGGADQVRARQERAGLIPDVETFRLGQAMWAMYGFACASAVIVVSGFSSGTGPIQAGGLIVVASLCGVIGRDYLLTRAAERRARQMVAEFPTIADMLALAVAAGQGPLGALEHVTTICHGPLSQELGRVVADAQTGHPLTHALAEMAHRTGEMSIARFADGLTVALERGTPLADVLRAQAQDARGSAKGELIETAGKKDVLMMAPVVFLVLPITVLFAVYPGASALNLHM